MFNLPEYENAIKVTVDKKVVVDNTEPIITHGKKESTSVA